MEETILVQQDGLVATVVLNRPQKLNALNKRMWQRLGEAIDELSARDDIRCLVIRGAGNRAFAPGNDISEFESERANVAQARSYGAIMHRTLGALASCRHPVVALIHGVCVGGGLEIAAHCDLRVCGESSRFGIPVGRLGLVMAYEELRGVLAVAGRAVVSELLLEGRIIGAAEAREKGLVSRVVPDAEVETEAYAAARRIAAGAPLCARWHKKFIHRLADPAPLSEAELGEGYACYGTEDYKRGVRAFLTKTEPEFLGR